MLYRVCGYAPPTKYIGGDLTLGQANDKAREYMDTLCAQGYRLSRQVNYGNGTWEAYMVRHRVSGDDVELVAVEAM